MLPVASIQQIQTFFQFCHISFSRSTQMTFSFLHSNFYYCSIKHVLDKFQQYFRLSILFKIFFIFHSTHLFFLVRLIPPDLKIFHFSRSYNIISQKNLFYVETFNFQCLQWQCYSNCLKWHCKVSTLHCVFLRLILSLPEISFERVLCRC